MSGSLSMYSQFLAAPIIQKEVRMLLTQCHPVLSHIPT